MTDDGGTVFAETRGDYVYKDGRPYTNTYIFKFIITDGLISEVTEYCNPVTPATSMWRPSLQVARSEHGRTSRRSSSARRNDSGCARSDSCVVRYPGCP